MSYLTLNNSAAPATPAAGKTTVFVDSADRYLKTIDEKGVLGAVGDHELFNWLRNSGFWWAQRQAPGSAVTYSSTTGRAICADGWGITNENASATYQRVDTVSAAEAGLGGRFYGTLLKITSAGKLCLSQVVEANDTGVLRGQTVRVQVWLKQQVAANPVLRLGLIQNTAAGTADAPTAAWMSAMGGAGTDPTLAANLAYITPKAGVAGDNCTVNGNAVDCTLTGAWQRFGAVFDVPAGAKNLIVAVWSSGQFAATNGFSISQASLTTGYEIQSWNPLETATELQRVQRFYEKSFLLDTAPAQNVGVNTGEVLGVAGKAGAVANSGFIAIRYVTPKVKAPATNVVYNPAAANALARNITGAADMGTTTITGAGIQQFYLAITGVAATTVGDLIAIHFSSDAEL